MKRQFLLGVGLMMAVSLSYAQSNSYQDDRYYNASEAQQEATTDQQQNNNSQQANSTSYNYDNNYNGSDSYIDYDDDSYTTRINRFNYPMGMSYWGSIYSPYYFDPFWYNPFNDWYGYNPGFSISFGFGSPYWSSSWGNCGWYGYSGFNSYYAWGNPYYSWNYPYYGGGYGYGSGYWNGFYDGYYANNYFNNNNYNNNNYNNRNTVYGPRGSRGMVGNYTRQRLSMVNNNDRVVTPLRSTGNGSLNRSQLNVNDNGRSFRADGQNGGQVQLGGRSQAVRYNSTGSMYQQNDNRSVEQATPQQNTGRTQRSSFWGSRSSRSYQVQPSTNNSNQSNSRPSRSYEAPSRSYQAPTRSYEAPSRSSSSGSFSAPSRSSSSFGGGSSRSSFGRGR